MENQKIINLLNKSDTNSRHFATEKWYLINDENNTNYGVNKDTGAGALDTFKYDTRVSKPNLWDYAEASILVDGTIRAAAANANTRLVLKSCAPFTKCNLEINDEHVDTAENLNIVMPMYNLIEYSDNYQDSSATLYQYKRDEPPEADAVADLTANNSSSFKYKINLLGDPVHAGGIARRNVKFVVPLKYLSNFFRSLEMSLINCKIKLNLTWKKECVLSTDAGAAVFIINDTIDPSFQGVNRLFLMAYSREANQPTINGHQKYYLPRIDLKKYNVIIDGRNFYDNPIENNSEKYRVLKKVMIGKEEDYTTGSLLDYNYFTKHHKLVAVDLSK